MTESLRRERRGLPACTGGVARLAEPNESSTDQRTGVTGRRDGHCIGGTEHTSAPTGDGYYMWCGSETDKPRPLDAAYYAEYRCWKCWHIEHILQQGDISKDSK